MTLFGADPEFFIVRNGAKYATSAHLIDLAKGDAIHAGWCSTLDDSYDYECDCYMTNHEVVDKDGFALELHPNPYSCREEFISSLGQAIAAVENANTFSLSAVPVKRLTKASLTDDAPDDVMGYGCRPDLDAYSLMEKNPPRTGYDNNQRFIGGHLHFNMDIVRRSISEPTIVSKWKALQAIQLDISLGIPLVAMLGKSNDYGEARRREYYGQAGSYREKSYGIEYRVPSSAVFMSPYLLAWALGQARDNGIAPIDTVAPRTDPIKRYASMQTYDFDRVRHIINNHDWKEARKFIKDHKLAIYLPEFVDLMIDADRKGVSLNTSLEQSWNIDNVGWHGCEFLVYRQQIDLTDLVENERFPMASLLLDDPEKYRPGW